VYCPENRHLPEVAPHLQGYNCVLDLLRLLHLTQNFLFLLLVPQRRPNFDNLDPFTTQFFQPNSEVRPWIQGAVILPAFESKLQPVPEKNKAPSTQVHRGYEQGIQFPIAKSKHLDTRSTLHC
jgi:hypothetical protein